MWIINLRQRAIVLLWVRFPLPFFAILMCMYDLRSSSLTVTGYSTRRYLCSSSCQQINQFCVAVFQISVRNVARVRPSSSDNKPVCCVPQEAVEEKKMENVTELPESYWSSLANDAENS